MIRVYERTWPDEAARGGMGRRLVVDVPHTEIEEDDSGRPESLRRMQPELRELADQVAQARARVAGEIDDHDDRVRAAFVAHALNSLPRTGHASKDDPPCCASECAPCTSLVDLHGRGLLSDWVRPYVRQTGTGWDWWDGGPVSGDVNWGWVAERVCTDPTDCSAPGWCCSAQDEPDDHEVDPPERFDPDVNARPI